MTDLILHHYELSPFSEKVRLAFGAKNLAWKSVEISIWPPRPELEPLTAGFRRAPVLQIGADIYCDTLLILSELDRRHPDPRLFPDKQAGLVSALNWWAGATMFMQAASLTTSIIGDGLPEVFLQDRIAFMKHDFSKAASLAALPVNRQRVQAQMTLIAGMLQDDRPFLLGETVTAADLSAYHPLWFTAKNGGAEAQALLRFAPLRGWMERIAALGHGRRETMSAETALAAARAATPEPASGVDADDPSGLQAGTAVTVRTDEPGDPIRGSLVCANAREFVIRSQSGQASVTHVHFPRAGYSLVAEQA